MDAGGRPAAGAGLTVLWPTPSGSVKKIPVYTASDGTTHLCGPVSTLPLYRRSYVTLAQGGRELARAWFMPTPPLAEGLDGWAVTLSDTRPTQHTVLRAQARARDASGRPAAGLKTVFTWTIGSTTKRYYTYTDTNGAAYCSHDIGAAPIGVRAYVRGETEAAGRTRANMPSFVTVAD